MSMPNRGTDLAPDMRPAAGFSMAAAPTSVDVAPHVPAKRDSYGSVVRAMTPGGVRRDINGPTWSSDTMRLPAINQLVGKDDGTQRPGSAGLTLPSLPSILVAKHMASPDQQQSPHTSAPAQAEQQQQQHEQQQRSTTMHQISRPDDRVAPSDPFSAGSTERRGLHSLQHQQHSLQGPADRGRFGTHGGMAPADRPVSPTSQPLERQMALRFGGPGQWNGTTSPQQPRETQVVAVAQQPVASDQSSVHEALRANAFRRDMEHAAELSSRVYHFAARAAPGRATETLSTLASGPFAIRYPEVREFEDVIASTRSLLRILESWRDYEPQRPQLPPHKNSLESAKSSLSGASSNEHALTGPHFIAGPQQPRGGSMTGFGEPQRMDMPQPDTGYGRDRPFGKDYGAGTPPHRQPSHPTAGNFTSPHARTSDLHGSLLQHHGGGPFQQPGDLSSTGYHHHHHHHLPHLQGHIGGIGVEQSKTVRTAAPGRCHSCNISETPEWRRGPDGARTLCNACGLHYAKLTKKKQQQEQARQQAQQAQQQQQQQQQSPVDHQQQQQQH